MADNAAAATSDTGNDVSLLNAAQTAVTTGAVTQANGAFVAPEWAKDAPPELLKIIETKGYKTPVDVLKAYDGAQRAIGADKIVLPKDGVWSDDARKALGIPDKPEGYQIKRPELPAGVSYDEGLEKAALPVLHKLGLTPTQTQGLIDFISEHRLSELKGLVTTTQQQVAEAEATLRKEFGAAYDARVEQANRALAAANPGMLQVLKDAGLASHPDIVKGFAKLGAMMGEDKLRTGNIGSLSLSPAEARQEIARIMSQAADPKSAYMDGAHPEHKMVLERLGDLHRMAAAA